MATEFEGEPRGAGVRVAIAISRFNEELTLRLLEGALMAMQDHQVEDGNLSVAWVPGAFELPLMASTLAKSGNYDAIVCLGVVVKGETTHFDHISTQAATGIGGAAPLPAGTGHPLAPAALLPVRTPGRCLGDSQSRGARIALPVAPNPW